MIRAPTVGKSQDIAELRDEGGIPEHVRTVIEILPQQRVLEIRVEGLSVEADPDRTIIREVTTMLFELGTVATTTSWPSTAKRRRCSPNASCSSVPTADPSALWWVRPLVSWSLLQRMYVPFELEHFDSSDLRLSVLSDHLRRVDSAPSAHFRTRVLRGWRVG